MAEVGRNSPCPCGSGRRFKDCHGGLAQSEAPAKVDTGDLLLAALAAQRRGAFDEAIAGYQAVAAMQPANFDAWCMLGLAQFKRGNLEAARINLRKALTLRPFDGSARSSIHLVDMAIERRRSDDAICEAVLPRFAPRCVAAKAASRLPNWHQGAVDVVVLRSNSPRAMTQLDSLRRWLTAASASITLWCLRGDRGSELASRDARIISRASDDLPASSSLVFFGAEGTPGVWFASNPARWVALYCDDEPAAVLVDRIPELSREGQTPLHLLFSSTAQAQRLGLPGEIVGATDDVAAMAR